MYKYKERAVHYSSPMLVGIAYRRAGWGQVVWLCGRELCVGSGGRVGDQRRGGSCSPWGVLTMVFLSFLFLLLFVFLSLLILVSLLLQVWKDIPVAAFSFSRNCTPGSRCSLLAWQAHPSESCPRSYSHLVDTWLDPDVATSL